MAIGTTTAIDKNNGDGNPRDNGNPTGNGSNRDDPTDNNNHDGRNPNGRDGNSSSNRDYYGQSYEISSGITERLVKVLILQRIYLFKHTSRIPSRLSKLLRPVHTIIKLFQRRIVSLTSVSLTSSIDNSKVNLPQSSSRSHLLID